MTQPMTPGTQPAAHPAILIGGWVVVLIAVAALAVAVTALVVTLMASQPGWGRAANGYPGMMGGGYGPGMMGRNAPGPGTTGGHGPGMMGGAWTGSASQPGEPGFVPGTATAPRVVRVIAGPDLAFHPSSIRVVRGETVRFLVTTMGPTAHEFMVGPAADVAADVEGTPEIEDIGMMQTKALTYTFNGSGPYAFACHVEGHYEAGMAGTILVVG